MGIEWWSNSFHWEKQQTYLKQVLCHICEQHSGKIYEGDLWPVEWPRSGVAGERKPYFEHKFVSKGQNSNELYTLRLYDLNPTGELPAFPIIILIRWQRIFYHSRLTNEKVSFAILYPQSAYRTWCIHVNMYISRCQQLMYNCFMWGCIFS